MKLMKALERFSFLLSWPLLAILLAVLSMLILLVVGQVGAQVSTEPWAEPINLSLSAGASEPVLVVDSSGRAHALWTDTALNFMYTTDQDGDWAVARPVEVPFGTRRYYPDLSDSQATPLHTPVLWPDQNNRVNALWSDNDEVMFFSSVPSAVFSNFDAWSAPQVVAPSGSSAAAITDNSGRFHVAYVRRAENDQSPAGLYYRQSTDGGNTWSSPTLLFQSQYFRSLTPALANLQLAVTDNNEVVVAWDDPFQERVYSVNSGNGGSTWDSPTEIDRRVRTDGADAFGPNAIQVATAGRTVHLVWQAGHEGVNCAYYHQVSADGGNTWQPSQQILESLPECPESSLLVPATGETILLLLASEDGGYIAAWNGRQWGLPQTRPELTTFLNPLNYREVQLDCQQAVTSGESGQTGPDMLMVLGCDAGVGGDIWLQTAVIGSLVDEIAPLSTPVWQSPDVLGASTGADSLQLVADADGWLHALWSQPTATDNPIKAIQYSRWDGTGWSQIKGVLTSPEGRTAVQPSVALTSDGRIVTVWSDGLPGSIYFSQADLARAGNATEWSSPVLMPMPRTTGDSPEVAVDGANNLYVAYAIPLNEERGVYLSQSADGGETWLGPVNVFDGAEAGWAMVDDPQLAIGDDGNIHLMWTRYSTPPDAAALAVYYSRSSDGGVTWSEAMEVTQATAVWTDLSPSGDLSLHRFWLEEAGDLWHQSSRDSGVSWAQPLRVSGSASILGLADSVVDGAGQPWLLQAIGTRAESGAIGRPFELRSWVLSDGRWIAGENLRLVGREIGDLSAAVAGGGSLHVIFSGMTSEFGATIGEELIYHSGRALELPSLAPTALPTPTPTPRPDPTVTPTPLPLPTATAVFPTEADRSDGLPIPIDTSNPLTGPLLGIIPAAVVVLIAFFIGVRLVRGDRR